MTTNRFELEILGKLDRLKADLAGARAEMTKADQQTQKFAASLNSLSRVAGLYVLAKSINGLAASAAQAADAFVGMERRFTQISGSSQVATRAMAFVRQTANEQGISIAALGDSYARLLPQVNKGRLTLSEMERLLKLMNDTAAVHRLSTDQLGLVYYGLSQALSQGRVQLQELNQVTEPIPGLLDALAAAANTDAGAFRNMVAEGRITSDMLAGYMLTALEENAGAAERFGDSYEKAIVRLRNSMSVLAEAISTTQVYKDLINGLADSFEWLAVKINVATGNLQRLTRDQLGQELSKVQEKLFDLRNIPERSFLGVKFGADSKAVKQLEEDEKRIIDAITRIEQARASGDDASKKSENQARTEAARMKELNAALQDRINKARGLTREQFIESEARKEGVDITKESARAYRDSLATLYDETIGKKAATAASREHNKALKEEFQTFRDAIEAQDAVRKAVMDQIDRDIDFATRMNDDIREQQEKLVEPFVRAADNMQDAFGEAFQQIFDEGESVFENLGKSIRRAILQIPGEMIGAALKPMFTNMFTSIGGAMMGNSIGGSIAGGGKSGMLGNFGSMLSSGFNFVTGGTTKALAGLGMSQGLAGALGTALPVAGLALGAFSLLGGMKKPGVQTAVFDASYMGGGQYNGMSISTKRADPSVAKGLADGLAQALSGIEQLIGTTLAPFHINMGTNSRSGDYYDVFGSRHRFSQDTSEYAYNNIALLALRNTPDAMKNPYLARAAWGQSAYQSSAQLNETIGLAANWTSIKDGPKAVSEYEQAMKDLDAEFKALTPAAMRLGIAIAGVEDEVDRAYVNRQRMLRDQFNKSISQQTLEFTDPIKAAVNTLNEQFDLIRRDAKAVGGDMAAVENLYKLRLAQIYEQYGQLTDAAGNLVVSLQAAAEAIVNLRAQADALSVSDLSPLSAADKYRIAEQQFLTQKALAESGNLDAINSLGDYGRQFLEISRFVNGGSASGAEDYFMVVSSLRSIAANLQNSTGLTNDDLTRMTGRASGGMVAPRNMYQVNESGVEMMVPAQHGSVVNASDTQQIARMIQGGAANGDMSRAITGLVSELRRSNNNVDQLVSMLVKNNQIRRTA